MTQHTRVNVNEQAARIQVLSALVSRNQLASKMGTQSYDGDRDLYEALGYKTSLTYDDFAARYLRQDMAKAVIDRPAKATWQGALLLQESKQAKETELETAWVELEERLGLKSKFSRVDRLSGIGCYGVLLLGFDDVSDNESWKNPVKVGKRQLMYVKPFGEGSAKILTYETKGNNPRYGQPLTYTISIRDTNEGSVQSVETTVTNSIEVHHSRVIHIIDDVLENDIIGLPKLEVIFNRLMDLEKVIGGDAEMFWRGARPGFQAKVDADFQLTPEMKKDLKDQIDEYEHKLRRMLANEGVTWEALQQMIADPSQHVDMQIQMMSAVTGIPKRILTGTERGELSSAQDASEWKSYVQGRRLDHGEPHIVRPFVNKCIETGVLPKPTNGKTYFVVWSDLYALSEAEKVKIGLDRSTALKNYTTSPMSEGVVSPDAFFDYFLGLDENQIEVIKQKIGSEVSKEIEAVQKQLILDTQPPKAPIVPPVTKPQRKSKETVVK